MILKNVRVHNLKGVDLTLDPLQFIVLTGVSGSGKSSLAFDTIYTEGQRRYIESLSTYARRHLGEFPKPEADRIEGISPTIAIEQKSVGKSPRSTVATMTGIYDFLRVLFARTAVAHCPLSGEVVRPQSESEIVATLEALPSGSRLIFLAPYAQGKKGEYKEEFSELERRGFLRIRLDGQIMDLTDVGSLDPQVPHDVDLVVDRLVLPEGDRMKEAVKTSLELGKGMMIVIQGDQELLFSQHAYAKASKRSYPKLEPSDFSFNHPKGMCETCQGLGVAKNFDLDKVIAPEQSIQNNCCSVAPPYETVRFGNIYDNLARLYRFKVTTPWKELSRKARDVFLYGVDQSWIKMKFVHPQKRSEWVEYVRWEGVLHEAMRRYHASTSELYRNKMELLMQEAVCPSCQGSRLKPYPAAARIEGKRVAEVTGMSIEEAVEFMKKVPITVVSEQLVQEITRSLEFLVGVGLGYLTLDRTAPTLSGGEAQRVRLSSQIGAGLVGTTYVLDEPSIGLHPIDSHRLLNTLKHLRDQGNTVIVVEHDAETIHAADTVVDVGPLAGVKGGEVLYVGPPAGLVSCPRSITGDYLAGRSKIPIPSRTRKRTSQQLTIVKAAHHNLQQITVQIPLGLFVAVAGVSGSGKSSLISDILYPALTRALHGGVMTVGHHEALKGIECVDKVIHIDQDPIGKTPRSNPATYLKVFDEIRDLFSALPESQALGYTPGRFSFNVKEGSCPHCTGMGMVRIDMDFLEDVWVTCTYCQGRRFDEATLSIRFKGKTIHDILEMSVEEASHFFASFPSILRKLDTLLKVGLDYLKLGQSSPTLSGGESQRIKLAKELCRPETGQTVYILDEPTTGLHFHDIAKLVTILQSLVDKGNTVVVVEHNMDVVKAVDWVIELGPEGGSRGGFLVAEGTPRKIAQGSTATGQALRQTFLLSSTPPVPADPVTHIVVEGASQHNLHDVTASFPRGSITLCTGPSGSGKSSFAFDTVYAEGQRRYVESMSPYARQFLEHMPKAHVHKISGLSPAIAVEQKIHAGNPRSTVGTLTEAYDFLRILYAYLGVPFAPTTGVQLQTVTPQWIVDNLLQHPEGTKLYVLSEIPLKRGTQGPDLWRQLQAEGYLRIRLDGVYYELDAPIPWDTTQQHKVFLVVDRCLLQQGAQGRLMEAIERATHRSRGTVTVDVDGKDYFYNLALSDPTTGISYPSLTPHTFSFNTEGGMCPDCLGLGVHYGVDLPRHEELWSCHPLEAVAFLCASPLPLPWLKKLFLKAEIDPKVPLKKQPPEALHRLLYGTFREGPFEWIGLGTLLAKAAKLRMEYREAFSRLLTETPCTHCEGSRLHPLARNVTVYGMTLGTLCALPVNRALQELQAWEIPRYLEEPYQQLCHRLRFLDTIGLGYLSLNRTAPTLSGGETQRIRLSRQLGSGLTGCLYVLDEPTMGLHPKDNVKLNNALRALKGLGNTLLLVEHDPLTLQIADHILDFGPGAGKQGGRIVASGSLAEIQDNPDSLTGAYLSGKLEVPYPSKRREPRGYYPIGPTSVHNLKQVSLQLPWGVMTGVTGVSGSGKSTLIYDVLKPAVERDLKNTPWDQLISLDQNPVGRTHRSTVASYTDLLTPLRYLFAALPAARSRGLTPKHFSYNHPKGMCRPCRGMGYQQIQLQLLPAVTVPCPACQGFRLNPLSLSMEYRGHHLGQVLHMSLSEAQKLFSSFPHITRALTSLTSVGLDYLQLGQEMTTLSGGEQQRIRLSRELAKRARGKTLYLFDEPTIGLHSHDIAQLLPVFHRLVDQGHTVVMIEHNTDIINNCDYLLELGPGAGEEGGRLIAHGTPEALGVRDRLF